MKTHFFKRILVFAASCFFLGCQLEQKTYKTEMQLMQDSLFAAFPTVNRVGVEVKTDFGKELIVTLGDVQLFEASEERKEEVSRETARLARGIFAAEDLPGKGKMVFVREEQTLDTEDSERITLDLPLQNQ